MDNSNNCFFLICLASFLASIGIIAWCYTENDDSLFLKLVALGLLCVSVGTFIVFRNGMKNEA
jgi:hypothetical protein